MEEQHKRKIMAIADYERHQELYEKKMALLREYVQFVEQKRKTSCLKRRYSPLDFERVMLRLKQSQADIDDVRGKSKQLVHMVDDMLQPKQVGMEELPSNSLTKKNGKLDTLRSKTLKRRDDVTSNSPRHITKVETSMIQVSDEGNSVPSSMCNLKTQTLASVTESFGMDRACSLKNNHVDEKLEDLVYDNRKVSEQLHTEEKLLEDLISYNGLGESENSEDSKTSEEMQDDCEGSGDSAYDGTKISVQLPNGCISSQGKPIPAKPLCSAGVLQCEIITNTESCLQNALKSAPQSVDNSNGIDVHESIQKIIVPLNTVVHMSENYVENVLSEKQERTEYLVERQTSFLEQEEIDENHKSPSQEYNSSNMVILEAEDEIIIKRNREALSWVPFEEKLKLLDNIYRVIVDRANTWELISEYSCDPSLIFSIIEVAKMGKDKVEELLGSECSGLQLSICYKAICELVCAFPEEDLVPIKFVEEYLLGRKTSSPCEEVKKNDILMAFQNKQSALFWSSLIHPALYLVRQNIATVAQLVSMFSNILLPTSRRFEDLLCEEEFNEVRLNFNTFMTQLLTEEMDSRVASSQKDYCKEDIARCNTLTFLKNHEQDNVVLSPILEKINLDINQEAIDEPRSPSFIADKKSRSCLSCKMIMRVLLCKNSRVKHT